MTRLGYIWRLLNLPCREMARFASASLDGDLGRLERIALRAHLAYCVACRRYLRQILILRRVLRAMVTHLETEAISPETRLPDEVRARIKQALRSN
jgi:predicted anti-sigma-YlaC factor YlaD